MDIRQWFSVVDEDKSGHIDAKELQKALGMGNLHFSLQVVASMIRMYDKDRSGTINFEEFQGLHQFLMDMHASFHHFDTDRSGTLEKHEVQQALAHSVTLHKERVEAHGQQQCAKLVAAENGAHWLRSGDRAGFHLDQHAFGAAFWAFDPDRNGTLGTPEFVALTVFCKNTAAMFHAFDPQGSGRVGLDYNQFVYAASNCK